MKRDIESFAGQQFDLVVIGGGIHGAATAREAALGGLKVALIEARDFASGASSRSTKLIHGGLRYLENFQFGLVREARQERRLLMELAPQLVRPLTFLLPIYRDDPFSPFKIRLGLAVYDLLGSLGAQDRHRMLTPHRALELMPGLRRQDLRAAALYHDSCTDDARLTIETVIDAADHGAAVANYAEVQALAVAGGRVTAAEVRDAVTGRRFEVSGRFFVNAAGPWVDRVRALLPGYDGSQTVRLTKGVHVVVPPVTGNLALLAAVAGEDRIFLMWPWHGGAILGTTDTDFEGDPATVSPGEDDVDYLLRAAGRVLTEPLSAADVRCSWAGLRALEGEPGHTGAKPSTITRGYRFHEDLWAARNLISICGGKLTTARALGAKLAQRVAGRLGMRLKGLSSSITPFPGGHTGPFEAYVGRSLGDAGREFGLDGPIPERIIRTYGSRWRSVLEPIRSRPELAEPLPEEPMLRGPSLIGAEVAFAANEEMAQNSEDFLLRRSGLSWMGTRRAEARLEVDRILADRRP